MLEKIRLPAKPSFRGNNWVVDASHCQGCSCQFTFINRKHHCRRCGGIFCGTCTQQRMVLRGQGDSPVRICDPCKKLEEVARFELRYGHRSRAGRGSSSRTDSSNEDEVLAQVVASDVKEPSSSSRTGSSTSTDLCVVDETITTGIDETVSSASPEDLRQQAMDEKKKYKILKGEGKNEEALKAFKRGKELERQAHALYINLRKSSRWRVLSGGDDKRGQNNVITAEGSQRSRSHLGGKDDLMSELKQMGWSDMDLENEVKKSKNVTVEGELLALIGETSSKKADAAVNGAARTQVADHKRKAVLFKKEGKLADAKEELKKAKILERQAEEQQLLAGAEEDSDDEFADLIRSMDSEKEENPSSMQQVFDMGGIPDIDESNFEVTEDDMEDPELAGALQSLGWMEEEPPSHVKVVGESNSSAPFDGEAALSSSIIPLENEAAYAFGQPRTRSKAELQRELLGLKRKALGLRREGNTEEAEQVQKMAKTMEDQISELEVSKKKHVENTEIKPPVITSGGGGGGGDDMEVTENDLHDPALLVMLNDLGWKEEEHGGGKPSSQTLGTSTPTVSSSKAPPRSKAKTQRELLGMKRKALEHRRKGEMVEAEEVSNKAKVLEAEIEELEACNVTAENRSGDLRLFTGHDGSEVTDKVTESNLVKASTHDGSVIVKGGMATENAYSPLLKTVTLSHGKAPLAVETSPLIDKVPVLPNKDETSKDTQGRLKQEISDHRKRALALKRQGKLAEAREELKQAKLLERSLESEKNPEPSVSLSSASTTTILQEKESHPHAFPPQPSSSSSHAMQEKERNSTPLPPPKQLTSRERFKIQQESLIHKRQAMKLRREGRIQEAEAEFELAKAFEVQLEESASHDSTQSSDDVDDVMVEDFLDPQLLSALKAVGIGGGNDATTASTSAEKPAPAKVGAAERLQLEEQIKAEKVKAVKLKRVGKQTDAIEALRRAKLLERKLDSLDS